MAAAVAALAFAVRLNALNGAFVWDDRLIVEGFGKAGGFSVHMLVSPSPFIPGMRASFYRPLIVLIYGIGWTLGGSRPLFYHLVLILLHSVVAGAVAVYAAALLRTARRSAGAGWWAGFAFAVLPIHTQSVAWITGGTDILCTLGLLGAALAGLAASQVVSVVGTAVGLLFALLSKETALAGLIFLPLQQALLHAPGWRRRRVLLACVVAVLAYLAMRAASGFSVAFQPPVSVPRASLAEQFTTFLGVAGTYAIRLVVPIESLDERFRLSPSLPLIAFGAVSALAFVVALVQLWRHRDTVGVIGLAWLGVFLLPALMPAATYTLAVALHRLYLPSIGLVIVISELLVTPLARSRWKRIAVPVGSLVLLILAVLSWRGNLHWRDRRSFWTAVAAQNPHHAMPLTSLAEAYLRSGDAKAALPLLERAASGRGTAYERARAYEQAGGIYLKRDNLAVACERFEQAAALLPDDLRARKNATVCRAGEAVAAARVGAADASHLLSDARSRLEQLVAASPRDAMLHRHLGEVLLAQGHIAAGREQLEQVLVLGPNSAEGHRAAGILEQLR